MVALRGWALGAEREKDRRAFIIISLVVLFDFKIMYVYYSDKK